VRTGKQRRAGTDKRVEQLIARAKPFERRALAQARRLGIAAIADHQRVALGLVGGILKDEQWTSFKRNSRLGKKRALSSQQSLAAKPVLAFFFRGFRLRGGGFLFGATGLRNRRLVLPERAERQARKSQRRCQGTQPSDGR
jgi:hypothetical protein